MILVSPWDGPLGFAIFAEVKIVRVTTGIERIAKKEIA
jgi:hypothetical protein